MPIQFSLVNLMIYVNIISHISDSISKAFLGGHRRTDSYQLYKEMAEMNRNT